MLFLFFILADDKSKAAEAHMIHDIGGLFALRMKAYMDGCREAGVTI